MGGTGQRVCPLCGKELRPKTPFCDFCGHPVEKPEEEPNPPKKEKPTWLSKSTWIKLAWYQYVALGALMLAFLLGGTGLLGITVIIAIAAYFFFKNKG